MITAKIVGAGGYGGVGITELILRHPNVSIGCMVSLSDTGKLMSDVYPHLKGKCDIEIVSPDHISVNDKFDVVIYSTPDGVGMCTAEDDLNRGAKVIDYSGDFRFNNMSKYEQYINKNDIYIDKLSIIDVLANLGWVKTREYIMD